MRAYKTPFLAAVIGAAAVAVVAFSGWVQNARAMESFELGQYDHILAESPGCHVECRALGGVKRICTINAYDCKAVCMELPECNVNGRGAPKVCAIMKTR